MTREEQILAQAQKYIRLVITDRCNLNCYYCHGEMMERTQAPVMRLEQILQKLKIAAANGVNKLKVTGGEPFCYPHIFELLHETEKFSEEVGLTSNGTLITGLRKQIENLPRNIRFNITLNTLDPAEYIYITGSDALQDAIDGINLLHELGFPLKVNMIVRKPNLRQIPAMIEFVKGKNIILKLMDLVDSKSEEFVSKPEIFEYLREHYQLEDTYSDIFCRLNINSAIVQLPERFYTHECNDCSMYPCSEGFLSVRMSEQGLWKRCFAKHCLTGG